MSDYMYQNYLTKDCNYINCPVLVQMSYMTRRYSSLGAHPSRNRKVVGSNLATSTLHNVLIVEL